MDLPSLLFLILFFTLSLFSDLTTADKLDLAAESGMIFPLSYSSLPPRVEDFRRRLLHQSQLPNAHMKLYDDLLANGFEFYPFIFRITINLSFDAWKVCVFCSNSYYTTRLLIGTPPQEFALIVDTGSTVTYVPCSTCKHCGKHQVNSVTLIFP